ncbi:MAG: hypothetical protein LBR23_02835 [Spirochaetaceae bacterium]|jgi:hypothetical protein|nr:hypothetical protein [Spirochaetaceae bacterium]
MRFRYDATGNPKKIALLGSLVFLLVFPHRIHAQDKEQDARRVILAGSTSVVRSADDTLFLNVTVTAINSNPGFRGVEAVQAGTTPPTTPTTVSEILAQYGLEGGDGGLAPEFAIIGTRSPRANGQTVYTLILLNLVSGSAVATEQLTYITATGATTDTLTAIVGRMLALIPSQSRYAAIVDTRQKTMWLYPYLMAGGNCRWYFPPAGDDLALPTAVMFMGVLGADVQLLSFANGLFGISAGAEIALTQDSIPYETLSSADEIQTNTLIASFLEPSVLLKLHFYPRKLVFSVGGGAYFIQPLNYSVACDLPLGFTVTLDGGTHLGPGILSLSARYSSDLGLSYISIENLEKEFARVKLAFGISYKIGLFSRSQKKLIEVEPGWGEVE